MSGAQSKSGESRRCALVVTAVPPEYRAVRAHLTDVDDVLHPRGNIYEKGEFKSGDVIWDVSIVEMGRGNMTAAIHTGRAIEFFNPKVVLLIGVAGGIKDVRLGDVVVPQKVYGYEYGKAEEKFKTRPEVGKPDFRTSELAKAVARKGDWRQRILDGIPASPPEVFIEPIAAGEKVAASTKSKLYQFLREHYNDAIAVEMEGHGFLEAAFINPQVEAIVIRGISDLINEKTETDKEDWQNKAARHAAAFAFEVLSKWEPQAKEESAERQVWNITLPRNPHFTGREDLLKSLRDALTAGHRAALTQAIHGLGGVGKTQTALEYCYRHRGDYSVVWWVRSEKPAQLASDYAGLAEKLDLPEKGDKDQTVTIAAVKRWLEENSGWLMVFDNAPGPDVIREYLPGDSPGHIIITSRDPHWHSVVNNPVDVPVLPRDEAVEFLLERTKQDDQDAAGKLADALGRLPLALEQAGAYIEHAGKNIADYLELFKERSGELMKYEVDTDYEKTVATTWDINFTQVRKESPEGAGLLNLCAFMAPDDIPLEIISVGAEYLPPPLKSAAADEVALDKAVAALRRYSLVEVMGDALSIHRMVQAVVRDKLVGEAKKQWARAAAEIVNMAFPFDSADVRTWPVCSRLLPHALAAADHAATLGVASEAAGRLLNQAGVYLHGRAQFVEAITCYKRSLEIGEKTLGKDYTLVAIRLGNLGFVLKDIGDFKGAKAYLKRSLGILKNIYGEEHPDVAKMLNNLGLVLQDIGDLKGAKICFEKALEIGEKILGKEHPEVAVWVNNLGLVLLNMGDPKGAEARFERALRIGKKMLGKEHPKVAIWVNNLGLVLLALGDFKGAKARFDWSLGILKKIHGEEHPDVAMTVNNLGGALQNMGDLKGAKDCYKRALEIYRKFHGEDHPKTVIVRGNLESLERK